MSRKKQSDYHAENQDQPNRGQALQGDQVGQGQIQTRVCPPHVYRQEPEPEGAPAQDRYSGKGRRRKNQDKDAVRLIAARLIHPISIKEGLYSDASRKRRTQDAPPS